MNRFNPVALIGSAANGPLIGLAAWDLGAGSGGADHASTGSLSLVLAAGCLVVWCPILGRLDI